MKDNKSTTIIKMFNKWLDITIENRNKRVFYEIQEEFYDEILFAEMNSSDPLDWCKACQLGICETHNNCDLKFFNLDDSYGIEY